MRSPAAVKIALLIAGRIGGKLILYHGWIDQNISPRNSIRYYESAEEVMGGGETRDFARLFLAPGMGHCGGSPSALDALSGIESWASNPGARKKRPANCGFACDE